MAYTNNNGQVRIGVRSGITNSPIVQPAFSASLLQSLYGVWNGDTNTTELDKSLFGVWNAEASGTSLDTSIFAVYNADGDANDSKGTKHGTAQGGLTYTTGKINQAFQFNGSNAYIQLPNNSFNFTGDFSASLWVNFPSMAWQNGQLIDNTCWDSSGSGTSGWRLYYLYGTLGFYIYRENGLVQLETYSLNQANVWYHIVITTSSSGMKIYLNGALSVSNTSTTRPNYPNVVSTRLGASRHNNQFTTCKMDGVSTWSKELTPDEVTQLYNSGNGAQYPYSSQSLPSSKDSVGTNHGSLMNGCSFTTGKVGNAFSFDGVNDYVDLGDVMDIGLGSWSYAFWFKVTTTTGQIIFSKSVASGIVGRFWSTLTSNKLDFNLMSDGYGTITITSATTISTNVWYHCALVVDRSDKLKMYINGSLETVVNTGRTNNLTSSNVENPNLSSSNYNTLAPFRIGAYTSADTITATSFFVGQVDSFTVWNRAINIDDVTQLYNSGTGAQYPFTGTFSSAGNQLGVDNGTLMNGASLSTGKIGQAFTFDGVNDYVALPDNSFNFTGDFSVSAWIYVSNLSGEKYIISNVNGNAIGLNFGWCFGLFNNQLSFGSYGNTIYSAWMSGDTLLLNTWYHVLVTKKSSQKPKFYINGNLSTSTLHPNSTGIDSTNPIYSSATYPNIKSAIGTYIYNNGSSSYAYWNGKIDALNVWQKELTQSEITELYNSGNGKQITTTPIVQNGLVLNLDAYRSSSYTGTGTTWVDISGSGNNGTLVNGPIFGTANGGVMNFDGVNDYIDNIGDLSKFTFIQNTGVYTISAWVKPNSLNTEMYYLGNNDGTTAKKGFYLGNVGTSNSLVLEISNGTIGVHTLNHVISNFYTSTDWVNIVCVGNGVNNKVYKNGVLFSTSSNFSTFSTGNTSNTLSVSRVNSANLWYWNGGVSSVGIYNRSLSDSEVLQNFNATKGRFGL